MNARAVVRIGRGEHEHRLGMVELARDGLHRRRVELLGVEHDGERIAGKTPVGEDVERHETPAHETSCRRRVAMQVRFARRYINWQPYIRCATKTWLGDTNSCWASTSSISLEPAAAVRSSTPKIEDAARDIASAAERVLK
jgi:hypothetical protein